MDLMFLETKNKWKLGISNIIDNNAWYDNNNMVIFSLKNFF